MSFQGHKTSKVLRVSVAWLRMLTLSRRKPVFERQKAAIETPENTLLHSIMRGDRGARKGSRPISRVLSWVTIPLGPLSPAASSSLPGSHARTTRCRLLCDFPIWPCSRWGLPCHACYHARGALLPHHFTLTCDPSRRGSLRIGGIFLLHFPWARAPQALPGTVSEGARTFLHDDFKEHRSDHLADSEGGRYRCGAGTTIARYLNRDPK